MCRATSVVLTPVNMIRGRALWYLQVAESPAARLSLSGPDSAGPLPTAAARHGILSWRPESTASGNMSMLKAAVRTGKGSSASTPVQRPRWLRHSTAWSKAIFPTPRALVMALSSTALTLVPAAACTLAKTTMHLSFCSAAKRRNGSKGFGAKHLWREYHRRKPDRDAGHAIDS